jgi:hypothetical protein
LSLRLGLEAQYHVSPGAAMNPWFGYLESTGFSAQANGQTASAAVAGWEYGHLMAGLDFRLTKTIGIGPVLDFSFGQYTRESVQNPGSAQVSGDIQKKDFHEWLLIGGRVVLFP